MLPAVLVPALFISLTAPWSPREEIQTRDELLTGYVIGADEGRHLVLLSDSKAALWVETSDIAERRLCGAADITFLFRTVTGIFGDDKYDDCSTVSRRDIPSD